MSKCTDRVSSDAKSKAKAFLKLDLYDKNNLQNILKIRILYEISILYLIRHALVILIAGPHL